MLTILLVSQITLSLATPGSVSVSLSKTANWSIALEVRNKSRIAVEIWNAGFWPNHRWKLVDSVGTPVPLTSLGEAGARRFGAPNRDKNVRILLAPGKKFRYSTPPINLAFKLKPGTFQLSIVYRDTSNSKPLEVSSKPIRVVVGR